MQGVWDQTDCVQVQPCSIARFGDSCWGRWSEVSGQWSVASGQLSVASRQLPGTAGSGYELVARRGMGACSPILDGTTVGPIPGLMRVGIIREGTTEWPGHLAAAS